MPGYGLLPADQGAGLLSWSWFRQRMEGRLSAAGRAAGVTHAEVFKLIDDL